MNLQQKSQVQMVNLPSKRQIDSELGKRSLKHFTKLVWHIVSPDSEFEDGFHIDIIVKHLENLADLGETNLIRNLILNIPMRHSKSLICSIIFPAWVWTFRPSAKFLIASYSENLALDFSGKIKDLVKSDFYQQRWKIEIYKNQDTKQYWKNINTGFVAVFGSQSAVTGRGGTFLIADDILDAGFAHSDAIRDGVNNWFDNTFYSRVENPKNARRLVICQRLHQNDITGHLLEKNPDGWTHIKIPAEFEGMNDIGSPLSILDPRTEIGEPLWKARYDKEQLDLLKANMSELAVAGQLQQRPSTVAGNIFRKEWFLNRIDNTDIIARWISADTAQAVKAQNDPTAIVVGEITSDYRLFIRDVINKRMDFTELQNEVEIIAERYKYKLQGIIIESKSSGISLQQSIRNTSPDWMKPLVNPFNPQGSKEQRFYQSALWCEKGCVLLPLPTERYSWLFDFEKELFTVPNSTHDDQADSFSQLIAFVEGYLEEGLRYRKDVKN